MEMRRVENWTFAPPDEEIAADLRSFLPARMFDAHAHVYRVADLKRSTTDVMNEGPAELTVDLWRRHMEQQVGPSRYVGGLFFPDPIVAPAGVDAVNDYLTAQLESHPDSRGLILVHPAYPREAVERYLDGGRIVGFKVYHTFSTIQPTFDAPIESFLPEWAWQIANSRGLIILLHMVKRLGLADPDNQQYIRRMCARYANAKLILAHAARGFHAPNTANGLPALRNLTNVWFDTSGVCESAPLTDIIEAFGPRRLLWGTDFPVSQTRGRCVTMGDGFAWLQPDTLVWDRVAPHGMPTLVGLESLRALRQTARDVGLNDQDLMDICCDNALRLLGMKTESGNATQALYRHAKERIPGGTQLLSKRPELLAPNQWPPYFREARGCEVWDLDGRHYYDMSTNGIGSCMLGFRDPDVTRAVKRRITLGSMCTLNAPEEVVLADRLCEIHPWAQQVRFARTGGESMAVAVRIARATTRRPVVAICGYHGWHDWYLAANLGDTEALNGHLLPGLDPGGVPVQLRGTTVAFRYDRADEFETIIARHGDQLAAVVMEPCRFHPPKPGFLESVREATRRCGALLIFDEITVGWRLGFGGAHLGFGVTPDMAVFAKAMGNGHPIGAVIGTAQAMAGAHTSFISSTYWTEGVGPTAALATIEKMQRVNLPAHVARVGTQVFDHWRRCGKSHGLPVVVDDGYPCLAHFRFDHELEPELRTLYTQYMLAKGFLAGCVIYPTLAHDDEVVARYGAAIDEVFGLIAEALNVGRVRECLAGPVAHSGFRRLT